MAIGGVAKWYELAGASTSSLASTISSSLSQASNSTNFNGLSGVKLVGSDTINGHAAWHRSGTVAVPSTSTSASAGLGSGPLTMDVWVRQGDSYPIKEIIKAGTFQETVNFTAFNSGATIAPPVGAVAFPTGG